MDTKGLENKWQEIMKREFDKFIKEELGQTENAEPPCYGTGNGHIYCDICQYKDTC